MSEEYKYILRHKLKNPTYETDSNHQWFNIVDILQRHTNDKNNPYENEIQLHGILKDDNSVSTNNIKNDAVIASKTNFKIYGNGIANTDKDGNSLSIEPESIGYDDLSEDAKTNINANLDLSGAVDTNAISSGAIIWDHFKKTGDNAINWSEQLPENTVTQNGLVRAGNNNASTVWATDDAGNPGWRKVSNQFDTKLFGTYIGEYKPISNVFPKEGYYGSGRTTYTSFENTGLHKRYDLYTDDADEYVRLLVGKKKTSYEHAVTSREGQTKYENGTYLPINEITSNPIDYEFFSLNPLPISYKFTISVYINGTNESQNFDTDFQFGLSALEESKVYDKCYSVPTIEILDEYFSRIDQSYTAALDDITDKIINDCLKNLENLEFTSFEEAKETITEDYLQNICQDYYDEHFKKPEDTWTQLIEKKYDATEIVNPLSDWDYNHCGIWIEI